jgi:hypothetical protein
MDYEDDNALLLASIIALTVIFRYMGNLGAEAEEAALSAVDIENRLKSHSRQFLGSIQIYNSMLRYALSIRSPGSWLFLICIQCSCWITANLNAGISAACRCLRRWCISKVAWM